MNNFFKKYEDEIYDIVFKFSRKKSSRIPHLSCDDVAQCIFLRILKQKEIDPEENYDHTQIIYHICKITVYQLFNHAKKAKRDFAKHYHIEDVLDESLAINEERPEDVLIKNEILKRSINPIITDFLSHKENEALYQWLYDNDHFDRKIKANDNAILRAMNKIKILLDKNMINKSSLFVNKKKKDN